MQQLAPDRRLNSHILGEELTRKTEGLGRYNIANKSVTLEWDCNREMSCMSGMSLTGEIINNS